MEWSCSCCMWQGVDMGQRRPTIFSEWYNEQRHYPRILGQQQYLSRDGQTVNVWCEGRFHTLSTTFVEQDVAD
jgi:hypothetical protein